MNNKYFMTQAKNIALKSNDPITKVGCVIVHNDIIISKGFNTILCENISNNINRIERKYFSLHAEKMAICSIDNIKNYKTDIKIFVTLAPCLDCLKELIFLNYKDIFYLDTFGTNKKINFLKFKTYINLIECYNVNIKNINNNLDFITDILINYEVYYE